MNHLIYILARALKILRLVTPISIEKLPLAKISFKIFRKFLISQSTDRTVVEIIDVGVFYK